MKDDLVEAVARAIYDELEGPINNQDYSRQLRQWERAKGIALAAIVAARPAIRREALEEAAALMEKYNISHFGDGPQLVPRKDGDLFGLDYATAIRALGKKP
jgi:hypothetical protein